MDCSLSARPRTRRQKEQFLKDCSQQKNKNSKKNNGGVAKERVELVVIDEEEDTLNLGFNGSTKSESLSVDCNGEDVGSVGSVKVGNLGSKKGKRRSKVIGFSGGSSNCGSTHNFGGREELGLQKSGNFDVGSFKIECSVRFDVGNGGLEGKKAKRSDVGRTQDGAIDDDKGVLVLGGARCHYDVGDDRQGSIISLILSSDSEVGGYKDRIFNKLRGDDGADSTGRFRGKSGGKGSSRESSSKENEGREGEVVDKREMGEKGMAGGVLGEGEDDEEVQMVSERTRGNVDSSISSGDDKDANSGESSESESSSEEDHDSDYSVSQKVPTSDNEAEQSSDDDDDDDDQDNHDDDNDDDNLTILVDEDDDHVSGKEKGSPHRFIRKKVDGLEVLHRDGNDKGQEHSSGCLASRTRSHYRSMIPKEKLRSLGTVSRPFCIDDELILSSPEHHEKEEGEKEEEGEEEEEEEEDHKGAGCRGAENFDIYQTYRSRNGVRKRGLRKERELELPQKRRHIHEENDYNGQGSLVDSISEDKSSEESEHLGDKEAEKKREASVEGTLLQQKFTFGVEHQKQPGELEYDEEEGNLWKELELGLASTKNRSADPAMMSRSNNAVKKSTPENRKRPEKPLKKRKLPEPTEDGQDFEALDLFGDKPTQGDGAPSAVESPLELKFTFGFEPTKQLPEKSESDKELDNLWKELELGLAYSEINSPDSPMGDLQVENGELERGISQQTLCCQGKHHLVLDEEIGMKCTICSHVNLEIRHIVSPFCEHPFGIYERRDYGRVDRHILDGPPLDEIGCIPQDRSHDPASYLNATVWDIIPGIKQGMYPHQREGFEFLWKNIAGATKLDELRLECTTGGCILSHAPGTGKTRLTIAFLQTYMKQDQQCRPVIIAPCNILPTWEEEFRKWNVDIPFHNLNNLEPSGKEDARFLGKHQDKKTIRLAKLYSWGKNHGILGISYRLFEQLAGEKIMTDCVDGKQQQQQHVILSDSERKRVRRMLLELPGLLVLDEGHIPRNEESLIFKALLRVETEKCIILSGTPFQNNLSELYNTLCLVRPQFLDTILSGRDPRNLPIKDARKRARRHRRAFVSTLTNDDDLEQLRARIRPFVHVHKGNILQKTLPGLRDFVVVLQPTCWQRKLLQHCFESYKKGLTMDYRTSLISLHPYLSCKCLPKEGIALFNMVALKKLKGDVNAGVKTRFVMELIRLSIALDEKVLIFSQFIKPLKFIKELLESHLGWSEGQEMLFMTGEISEQERRSIMSSFNKPSSRGKVLLASTKACSEGISLIGASRVVLLDTAWNPSVERQAIGRAYRIGQKKVVHVYHLITSGTHEGEKHGRQIEKDRVSKLVFCSANRENEELNISAQVSEDRILEHMVQPGRLKSIFEKIYPPGADSNLIESYGWVNTWDS
ncbi:hypothetical protein Ancab_015637 [Ancistrocladus abbreviatus]